MNHDDLLARYPIWQILEASKAVDELLLMVAENWILHDAGYVDAFGMMSETDDLIDYGIMREYLFTRGIIDPAELRQTALDLMRNGR